MKLRIMDWTGDSAKTFDIDDPKAKAEAEALFHRMQAENPGGIWYTKEDGPAKNFSDLQDENVFVKRFWAG